MNELTKIREVSAKYDISAHTLRYYEDMGLISSIRSDDYAYRMYDDTAVKRLEQILILRKLNICIKDIQRIFNTSGSEVVLEVLGKKADDIDGEIALLHELKGIVLEFIHQIENADFSKDSDVRLLYKKAKDIEQQIINVGYNGNTSNVNRLIQVTEKLEKMPNIKVIEIPSCKMLTSGRETGTPFSEGGTPNKFDKWLSELAKKRIDFTPHDFMWDDGGLCMELCS